MKINSKVSLFVLILLASIVTRSAAQSSTFTYQGRLTDGGAPANGPGPYQMQFTLFPSAVGGDPLGPAIQLDSVAVANGVFTVELNFTAPNAFNGGARWLEIAVKKPTDYLFSLLTPRQPLTSTPYALRTLVATSADALSSACTQCVTDVNIQAVDGSKVTGTVPNAANAINVTGVVPGAIKWQVVSGQSQQAQANTGYLTTNDGPVTITLPTSPNIGDVVRVSGTGAGGWKIAQNTGQSVIAISQDLNWIPRDSTRPWGMVASSADGNQLVAAPGRGSGGGQLYTSSDSGVTWIPRGNSRTWQAVASSADGSKLVAVEATSQAIGQIYTSTDSGVTWTPRETNRNWYAVASSADGSKLVAAEYGGQIYTSTDSGATWTPRDSNRTWASLASSADGTKLVAITELNDIHVAPQIYTSSDSGVTWVPRLVVTDGRAVASSADGSKLVAVARSIQIYTSTDSGVTWTARETSRDWSWVASSADGTKLVAVTHLGGQIYISADSGAHWKPSGNGGNWSAAASSADGAKLVAVDRGGYIYTSSFTTTTGIAGYLSGLQFSSIELQYIGNGKFLLISHEGNISGN